MRTEINADLAGILVGGAAAKFSIQTGTWCSLNITKLNSFCPLLACKFKYYNFMLIVEYISEKAG